MCVWVQRFLVSDEQNDHTQGFRTQDSRTQEVTRQEVRIRFGRRKAAARWSLETWTDPPPASPVPSPAYSVPSPFASTRASQPDNIPIPPIGVIAPNHLKLVNAIAYSDPLKITTPISIR